MNLLPSFYFSDVEFLHENYVIFNFPFINNKLESINNSNHHLTLYGNIENFEKFQKIFDEISYCNKKLVNISCNLTNDKDRVMIHYNSCFATQIEYKFLGQNLKLVFELFYPTYYFAGAAVAAGA